MEIRSDLSSQKFVLNPFITPQVYPVALVAKEAGPIYGQQYKALSTVETTRGNSAEPSATIDTFKAYAYDTVEAINPRVVDDRFIGYIGGKDKAQAALATVAGLSVMNTIETRTAVALLDSATITNVDASTTGTTLAETIDSVVQTLRQTPGVEKIGLVCSEYVYTSLILSNASVQARLAAPANVVFNSPNANFRDAKGAVLAGEFMLDKILTGSNASWHTGVTKKNYCAIMALPLEGRDQHTQMQVGVTAVYNYPDSGNDLGMRIATYYDDRKLSEVVVAVAETQAVELNPELARIIKIA